MRRRTSKGPGCNRPSSPETQPPGPRAQPPAQAKPNFLSANPRVRRFLVLLTVLIVGASTLDRAVFHENPKTDFTVYTIASRAALDGREIYRIQNARGWNYVYLPLFSIVMIPLAKLPLWAGVVAWYVISVAAVYSSIRMCSRMIGRGAFEEGNAWVLDYAPILLVLGLFLDGIARGQASIPMLWLVVAAVYLEWKRQPLRAGACLAGAVLLKVFPLALLAYFAWRRRWRLVAATLAFIAAGIFVIPPLVFGWERNLALLNEWTQTVAKPALSIDREASPLFEQLLDPGKPRNQSLDAVFNRVLPRANGSLLAVAAGLIMAAVMLAAALKRRDNTLLLSAVMCWMLLISPVAENHYFVLLLFPLTALVALHRTPVVRLVLLAFFIAATCRHWIEFAKFYGSLCWGTFALWLTLVHLMLRSPSAQESSVPFDYSQGPGRHVYVEKA